MDVGLELTAVFVIYHYVYVLHVQTSATQVSADQYHSELSTLPYLLKLVDHSCPFLLKNISMQFQHYLLHQFII